MTPLEEAPNPFKIIGGPVGMKVLPDGTIIWNDPIAGNYTFTVEVETPPEALKSNES